MPPRPSSSVPAPAQLVSLELLERTRRDLLARLLSRQPLFFEKHRFSIAALAATAQDDGSMLQPLFELLNRGDPDLPPAYAASLVAIESVASDAGHERLRVLDVDKQLPQNRIGHESLAVLAYLDFPDLFAQVKLVAKAATVSAYTEYFAKSNAPLRHEPARFAALARGVGELMAARGRPPFCEPLVSRLPHKTMVDLVIGRLPGTQERLSDDLRRAQFTDVITQRIRFFFHHESCCLGVQGHVYEREGVRRLAGLYLWDDAEHFRKVDVYSLASLAEDLDGALSIDGYSDIEHIELREIWIRRVDGGTKMEKSAVDLRETSADEDIRRALRDGGRVLHVKLMIKLARGGRAVRAEIEPPGKLDMARTDEDVVDIVRGWLALKSHMKLPEHAMPAEDAASGDA